MISRPQVSLEEFRPVHRESSDSDFLDEVLDRFLEAAADQATVLIEDVVDERPHLRDEVLDLARTSRIVAVQSQCSRQHVGGYEILEPLGSGGMGSVHLARQPGLG